MKIIVLETPSFKIDGGAYFGVVPKIIWEKKYPADSDNMCKAACRSLLIDDGEHVILIDTGIGDKSIGLDHDNYDTDYTENLDVNLQKAGYSNIDITDVVLTHLHFDHCGGTTKIDPESNELFLSFPNATHYISKIHWENAHNPNYREKSSFISANYEILKDLGKLMLVESTTNIGRNVELRLFHGHTPGLMLPLIRTGKQSLFLTGDLIPAQASVPLAWISAYDLYPVTSMEEKRLILNEAAENNWIFVFQHDYYHECCDLEMTPRGVRAKNSFKLNDVF
jgi:glyoxylase-like metal-dependent hydrolase (beta-lactamase superfamily II)